MSREGQIPDLPASYSGYLLVFNEPNNPEPYGHPLEPAEAARRYEAIRAALPSARLVVGGVSAWAIDWVRGFLENVTRQPRYWHTHGYVERYADSTRYITPAQLIAWWKALHRLTGGAYWITEFGSCRGWVADYKALISWMKRRPWIHRCAAYTSRQSVKDPARICSGVNLINWTTGRLTAAGRYYRSL